MMLQLNPTIPVYCRKHGDGEAIALVDYGPNVNTVWVVRLPGGIVKHFYSDDIRVYDNPMNGNGYDVPDMKDWYPDQEEEKATLEDIFRNNGVELDPSSIAYRLGYRAKQLNGAEFRLVISNDTETQLEGYIHPLGRNGDTLDFILKDNNLFIKNILEYKKESNDSRKSTGNNY